MPDLIERREADGIALLTLNRPDVLNALSHESFRVLRAHVDDIAARATEISCVILNGTGRAFCAGFDVRQLKLGDVPGSRLFNAETITALAKLPQPVIAAVHGYCFTGGLELALASDFIVAGQSAIFCDTHAKVGLMPGWGLPQRLARRIGVAAAKEMMFTARRIGAEEARQIGLASHVVPDEALLDKAFSLARAIAANAAASVAWSKRMIDGGIHLPLDEALAWEQANKPGRSADINERLAKSGF